MKKFLVALVALLSILFYTFVTTYTFSIYNTSDGYILSDSSIREQLYTSDKGEKIQAKEVKAGEGIYTRGKTVYFGEEKKVKANTAFPLYIKDGEAVQLLTGNETLITTDYDFSESFKYAILSNGRLFNASYEEADAKDYVLVHLTNNLYVNTKEVKIKTVLHEYSIPENSIIFFSSDFIRYYRYFEGEFIYGSIIDVDYNSTISFEGAEDLSYKDFLLKLGEIVEYKNSEYTKETEEEKKNKNKDGEGQSTNPEYINSGTEKPEKVKPNDKNASVDVPLPPEEADPQEQKELEIKYPDWEEPSVSLTNVFNPGVYTLKVGLKVHDPAGVIARGVSFYVYFDDELNRGKEATSQLIKTNDGTITGIINNLVPDSDYTVRASYRYYDEYGRIQDEVVVFDSKSFRTKTLSDLGSIEFDKMDATSNLFDKKIQVNNVKFKTSSDQDAVGSLFLVTARTYEGKSMYGKEAVTAEGFTSGSSQLSTLSAYEGIAYTTPGVLKSSKDYIVVFECRDRYGNVIQAKNDSVITRTCKSLPTASLALSNPVDDHNNLIISSVIINNSIKNADSVKYDNLRVKITDSTGKVLMNGNQNYFPVVENTPLRIDNLTLSERYTVSLMCDADNDDGKGKIFRTLDTQNLSTFFDYGNIYLTGNNLIKSLYSSYSADRVVFTMSFNDVRTNTQLISLVEELYFTIADSKGNVYATHYLTDSELEKLKNLESLTFDSYEFAAERLPSNTTYYINYADVRHENGKTINDPISSTFSTFATSKLLPECFATNIQGFSGYLAADLKVNDIDDYIEGPNVLVRVREKLTNKIVGSFSFEKNSKDFYELRLYSDAASSPNGMAYDIEGNTAYIVSFVAEELTDSIETFKTLDLFEVSTAAGITGNIYLTSLTSDGLFEELEYIESTGKEYIDTLYTLSSEKVRYEWSNIDKNASGSTSLFGAEISGINTNVNYGGILYGNASSRSMYAGYNSKSLKYKTDTTSRNDWILILDNGKSELYKNSSLLGSNTYTGELDKWNSIFIFCNNYRNSPSQYSTQRLYSFKIYDNDVLVRDYVPARYKITGEVGLYDLVEKRFYNNLGTGGFISGSVVTADSKIESNSKKVNAKLNIEIQDDEEWLFSKTVYVDVFKNNDTTGTSNFVETLTYKYTGKGTYVDPEDETSGISPIKALYEADIMYNSEDYYFLKLYMKLDNGSIIPVSNASFTTNEVITEITSITDFCNIKSSKGKYVVTRNLYLNATSHPNEELIEYSPEKSYDTSKGTWNKANASPMYSSTYYIQAQIDFQGFTFEYHGYSAFIRQLSTGAKISNLVLKTFAYYTRTAQTTSASTDVSYTNCYAAAFIQSNYGTFENVYAEMYQEDISDAYLYGSYWCSFPYDDGVTKYDYFKCNNIIVNNYGLINNFIVNFKTENIQAVCGGAVGVNLFSGTIRNGYVYSDLYADEDHDYNYKAQLYAYTSYNNANNYYNTNSAIVSRNQGGTIENIYCLADVYCYQPTANNYVGITTGYNYSGGVVRNTYTIGNVLRDGKPNNANYGPNIGLNSASVRHITDDYYISDYTYNSTRNSSTDNTINIPTGYVALKDIEWQTKILNANGSTFEIEDLIKAGYYPHLNYTSNCMPSQAFIPIPSIKKTDTDVTLTYEYEWGINKNLDAEMREGIKKILGNDFNFNTYLGDLVWDEKDENGFNSQIKVEVGFVVNKSLTPIYGLEMSDRDMVVRTIKEQNDGSGITQCYFLVYNPDTALNKYKITGVQWVDPLTGFKGSTSNLKDTNDNDITRDLIISFYRAIYNVEGDDSWQKLRENTKQNFRLYGDIDFSGYGIDKIFVYNYFEGVLDGNGHTIKNVELSQGQFNDYISIQSTQNTTAASLSDTTMKSDYTSSTYVQKAGIFSVIYNGTIENTYFDNINIESGFYAGAICGYANGALFNNVFVKDAYVVGAARAGGFVGACSGTEIIDSGIIDAKIMSISAGSNCSSMSYVDPDKTSSFCGGLVGYANSALKVNRSFADNIYLENLTSDFNYGFTGGIVGGANDATTIVGAYATGVIISGSRATGGIVGQVDTQDNNRFTIDDCYTDVDILGYNGSVGGLVGDSRYTFKTEGRNVVFGDVFYNTTTDDLTTVRSKYSLTTGYKNGMNAFTCDSAHLVLSKNEKITGTSFTKSAINNENFLIDGYLSSEFFEISKVSGVLPKLLGSDGKSLPNQRDNYIDANNSDVTIDRNYFSSYDNSSGLGYQIGLINDTSVTIDKVYFDYSYVDDCLGLDSSIIDSMTKHHAFKGGVASASTSSGHYTISLNNGSPDSYYDYYRLTAIKYTKRNSDGTRTTHYLKVNELLNIEPKYMNISNSSAWINNVANSRAENILLTGNVDFNNNTYFYTDNNANIIVNKLIGKDNKYTISNLSINGNYDFSTNKGYLYDFDTSFIRCCLSELRNVKFDNISVDRFRLCGIIHEVRGIMDNVDLSNCYVNNSANYTYTSYGSGLINYCSANVSNIHVDNCNVICPSAYGVGLLFGAYNCNFYSSSAEDILIENSYVKGRAYVGGFASFLHNFSCNSSGETKATFNNISVANTKVFGNGNYIGGIVGYTYYPHYNYYLTNSTVDNCYVQSNDYGYVGGMIGYANYIIYPSNNTVYRTTVKGVDYVGGFAGRGYIYPNSDTYTFNNTVRDSRVIATNSYAAGALGYGTYGAPSITYKTDRNMYTDPSTTFYRYYVQNTEVYGGKYVAGIIAHADNNYTYLPNNVVDNCTIKGNTTVGGIHGYGYQIVTSSIVKNSYIGSFDNAAEAAKYGITYGPTTGVGGISGSYGGYANCIVENCIIGGTNIDRVGGLSGFAGMYYDTRPQLTNTICKDCIVIGKDLVGGLFGALGSTTGDYYKYATNLYSNALVYGDDHVGGIAGQISAYLDTTTNTYKKSPTLENIYFTGTINSNHGASLLYGKVIGPSNMTCNWLRYVSSLPSSVTCQEFNVFFAEDDASSYKWTNLTDKVNNGSNMLVSFYGDASIKDQYGTKRLKDILLSSSGIYKQYCYDDDETVSFANSSNLNKFIRIYNSSDDIANKFHSELINPAKSSLASSYRYVGFETTDRPGYMPFVVAYDSSTITIFIDRNSATLAPIRGTSIINKVTDDYLEYEAMQGVYITGTDAYNTKLADLEGVYNEFTTNGAVATGIGSNGSSGKVESGLYYVLDYIAAGTSDKTYAIDTGVSGNNKNLELKGTIYYETYVSYGYIFGSYASEATNCWRIICQNSNNDLGFATMYTKSGSSQAIDLAKKQWHDFDMTYQKITIDGQTSSKTTNGTENSNTIALFSKNATPSNYSGNMRVRIASFEIYDNGELIRKYVPVMNEFGECGMYETISREFKPNNGTGTFAPGRKTGEVINSNPVMLMKSGLRIVNNVTAYASDIDKLNIEFSTNFVNESKDKNPYISIVDNNNNVIVEKEALTNFNYSLNYDFDTVLKIKYGYDGSNGSSYTVDPAQVSNHVMLTDNSTYAIYDHKLYINDVENNAIANPVHLDNGYCLDKNGNIYNLSTMNIIRTVGNISKADSVKPLYTFNYDSKDIYSYVYRTVVSSNSDITVQDGTRTFVVFNEMISIRTNNDVGVDPLYVTYKDGKDYTILLKKNSLYSIGDADLISRFVNFTNEDIRAISSNIGISSSNRNLLVEYKDGRIVDVNTETGECVTIGLAVTPENEDILSYLGNSLKSMFSMPTTSSFNLTSNKKAANTIINYMEDTNASIPDIVGLINENSVDDLANTVVAGSINAIGNSGGSDSIGIPENGKDNKGKGSDSEENIPSNNIEPTANTLEEIAALIDSAIKEEDKMIIPNYDEVLLDTANKAMNNVITLDSNKANEDKYVSVYDAEDDSFEIFDKEELLTDEEAASIDSRIVDQTKLKALYNELGESEDNANTRGIVLYVGIAMLIISLIAILGMLKKKTN